MADEPEVPRHEELMEFGTADGGGRRWGPRTGRSSGRAATRELVHRLDRSRALVIVAVSIVATALNIGFVGWATYDRSNDSGTATSAGTHGLSEDQAACFAFARIESRVSVIIGTAHSDGENLERSTLKREIELLDELASDYPGADYRLIVAFHEVADASVRFIADQFTERSGDLSSQRLSILNSARDACIDVAHFDTRTAQPVAS